LRCWSDPAAAKRAEHHPPAGATSSSSSSSGGGGGGGGGTGGETRGGVTGKGGYIGGNFGLPHRDFSYDEAFDDATNASSPAGPDSGSESGRERELPRVLSTWMPLTPVRTDNGCMCTHIAPCPLCCDRYRFRFPPIIVYRTPVYVAWLQLTLSRFRHAPCSDVVPAEFDPCFNQTQSFSHLR
jgi:hypothetical protein